MKVLELWNDISDVHTDQLLTDKDLSLLLSEVRRRRGTAVDVVCCFLYYDDEMVQNLFMCDGNHTEFLFLNTF